MNKRYLGLLHALPSRVYVRQATDDLSIVREVDLDVASLDVRLGSQGRYSID